MPDAAIVSIVDDDESSRVGTSKLVRSLGFKDHDFASAKAFLHSPQVTQTSCLISDIQMPDMSGIQLLDALRARGHNMPIVFVTAYPSEAVRAEAMSRGAVCFLTKPFDGETLKHCLEAALGSGI